MDTVPYTLEMATTTKGLYVVKLSTGDVFTFTRCIITAPGFVELCGIQRFLDSGMSDDPHYGDGLEVRIDSIVWIMRRGL